MLLNAYVLRFVLGKIWITTFTECSKESEGHKHLENRSQRCNLQLQIENLCNFIPPRSRWIPSGSSLDTFQFKPVYVYGYNCKKKKQTNKKNKK